ncbi:protein of unknown function [Paenibacillus sophorae]|uniref:DUF4365 domain-containing protein n=1 Tax=Paenibacillus sophorae TaxID=1333845 RepID=A0A1H8PZZ0_9BACL|nr:DUF4365 domain-containing protein [Paenibacillus sophorae]QWU15330.1 DUF4365 domain-containing protein [Paenibacillus sophorae]SEO47308.1 protein of unknown function [Paenibacillus sophorae]
MPKWKKNKKVEKQGVAFLEQLVIDQGSIFREVPGDNDTGIDGFIEFVEDDIVSGKLLAVQIKSGESYYNNKEEKFVFYPDEDHLNYWENYMLPVVMIFYSPVNKCSAWIGINEHLNYLRYHDKSPLSKIEVRHRDGVSINDLKDYINLKSDSRILLKCLDKCFDADKSIILKHFEILTNHPESRDRKIVIKVARELVAHEDNDVKKQALWYLGYCVGRSRWSWNPNNLEEKELMSFAGDICSDISETEIYELLCIVDNESFSGPMGLGERLLDVISCCLDSAILILKKTAVDVSEPIGRRVNALYLLYGCDDEWMDEDLLNKSYDIEYKDLFDYLSSDS